MNLTVDNRIIARRARCPTHAIAALYAPSIISSHADTRSCAQDGWSDRASVDRRFVADGGGDSSILRRCALRHRSARRVGHHVCGQCDSHQRDAVRRRTGRGRASNSVCLNAMARGGAVPSSCLSASCSGCGRSCRPEASVLRVRPWHAASSHATCASRVSRPRA